MHKFTTASAERLIKRINKRIGPKGLPDSHWEQLRLIEKKVKDGEPPRHAEETFLIELAEQVGA